MTKQEQFFYDNAGSSYDPLHETEEQGRERGAKALARAAEQARELDWQYTWEPDVIEPFKDGVECEACVLYDANSEILASLHGIDGATPEYRRVVEAELALEALGYSVNPVDQKYIVWSLDPEEDQTFVDIHRAASPEAAAKIVERERPYATLDGAAGPMLLSEYIKSLQEELAK
jgi:hypothetical protein